MIEIMLTLRKKHVFALWLSEVYSIMLRELNKKQIPSPYSESPKRWRRELYEVFNQLEPRDRRDAFEKLQVLIDENKSLSSYFKALAEESSSEASPARSASPPRLSIPSESEEEEYQNPEMTLVQSDLEKLLAHLERDPRYALINTDEWKTVVRKLRKRKYTTLQAVFFDTHNAFHALKVKLKGTNQWPDAKALRDYWNRHYKAIEQRKGFHETESSQSSEEEEVYVPPPIVVVSSEEEEEEEEPARIFVISPTGKRTLDSHLTKAGNTVLARGQLTFRVADLKSLIGQKQAPNDNVINAYAALINDRNLLSHLLPMYSVYVFDASFYRQLYEVDRTYDYSRAQHWTSINNIDVFSLRKVLVPIRTSHSRHWALAVINFVESRFEFYDSLGGLGLAPLANLRRWLQDEHMAKKDTELDLAEWTDYQPGDTVPQQTDEIDSALFALQFADCLAVDQPFDFQQKDMPELRYHMAYSIVTRQALTGHQKVPPEKYPKSRLSAQEQEQAKEIGEQWRATLDKAAMLRPNSTLHIFYGLVTKRGGTSDLLKWSHWQQITNALGPLEAARYARLLAEIGPLKRKIAALSIEQGKLVGDLEEWEKFGKEQLAPLNRRAHLIDREMTNIHAYAVARGYDQLLPHD